MGDYKALARRWRPQSFQYFVGQKHAITALQQSLDRQQVHHAHLLTGTRGVGKTSLARVLAKGLSCINGITATPCEQCEHCKAIESGNFIDLIEIDAASRTKVEDTKELLSQVNYPPVQGRYKIYLIDEVHSLSANSFNALLKTLEEPPEHIKFILATTDPQKLPVTIQSRCIQLHLQQLSQQDISNHLAVILEESKITFEADALNALADAAGGSMRDALSLLEQALSLNQNKIDSQLVHDMLGRAPKTDIIKLICSLRDNNQEAITSLLEKIEQNNLDYHTVLDQLITQLYEITSEQVLGSLSKQKNTDVLDINADQIQLYIQILIRAKNELDLYPDHTIGFNLTILRMMTFKLEQSNLIELMSQQQVSVKDTHEQPPTVVNAPNNSLSSILKQTQARIESADVQKANTATPRPSKIENTNTTSDLVEKTVISDEKNNQNEWERISQSPQCKGMVAQLISKSTPPDDLKMDHWKIQLCETSLNNLANKVFEEKIATLCHSVLGRSISISLSPKISTNDSNSHQESPKKSSETMKKSETKPASKKLKAFAEALDAKPAEISD